jgi:hypothetical protein
MSEQTGRIIDRYDSGTKGGISKGTSDCIDRESI